MKTELKPLDPKKTVVVSDKHIFICKGPLKFLRLMFTKRIPYLHKTKTARS